MKKKAINKKKKLILHFSRALLPPERFHSTKKGAHGYQRATQKKETRHAQEETN